MSSKKENYIEAVPQQEKKLASWVYQKFKEAVVAKQKFTENWLTYYNAWNNTLFEKNDKPSYKTNHVSNFVYSTIESMRPVLFDSNPAFEAIPITADSMQYANDMNTVLDWEWNRTNCQELMLANSIYTFSLGTSLVMLNYDFKNGEDGEVVPIPISPFNFFPDPLATNMFDGEWYIYATYMHMNLLKIRYPKHAKFIQGGDITFSELVNNRNENATINNQVLIVEMWCKDYATVDCENENGEKVTKKKYPNGRHIICAPELGLIFEDKPNPYDSDRICPVFVFKDIDVPFQFWGEGEVKWLLSPQREINDLYDQIIDNAKHTANMQWIIDTNAGIPQGTLTNRPGLIVRKRPGSEVRRDSPPAMPMYVHQMTETLKENLEVISGVHDVTRGQTPSGIQSAAAIVALQEAAQIRIRLKVTLHNNALGELGTEWVRRIKQFWKFNRLIPKKVDEASQYMPMQLQGMEMQSPMMFSGNTTYDFINSEDVLQHDYKIIVKGASALKNNRASMLDQMIRLMQTPAEDGMPCVPREAVLDYLPDVNKRTIIGYFDKLKQEQMQMQQQQQVNNDAMNQIQQLAQQLQQIGQVVGQMQQRFEQQDQEQRDEQLRVDGYRQGMNEAQAMQTQLDKSGQLPPELQEEIAQLDDESLAMLMQQHPELVDML